MEPLLIYGYFSNDGSSGMYISSRWSKGGGWVCELYSTWGNRLNFFFYSRLTDDISYDGHRL